jgi:hypothetical protein
MCLNITEQGETKDFEVRKEWTLFSVTFVPWNNVLQY